MNWKRQPRTVFLVADSSCPLCHGSTWRKVAGSRRVRRCECVRVVRRSLTGPRPPVVDGKMLAAGGAEQ